MAKLLHIIVPWWNERDLDIALGHLTTIDVRELRIHPAPPLYRAGVRYKREERGPDGERKEEWLTPYEVMRRGVGDCEDLACWRAAELRLAGERATAFARTSSIGWHIVVRRANGTIEDPSRRLGMK